MKNKIGWCNLTFNPVWGCLNHCEYCYARKIAKRFGKYMRFIELPNCQYEHQAWELMGLEDFKPTFLYSQFNKKFPKKPQRIFVGSMSEIAHWEKRWMEVILGRVLCYPQHTFQFLTKSPEVYSKYDFPKNCWLGLTIADSKYFNFNDYQKFKISNPNNLKFVSYEPLLDKIFVNLEGIDWVILGAETGTRKGKVIPKREWIDDIISYCMRNDIPFYMKDNLELIHPCNVKLFPRERG